MFFTKPEWLFIKGTKDIKVFHRKDSSKTHLSEELLLRMSE
ncbi:hypothetical protein MCERE19_01199 [Spirosomataceae bacterium]|jgi:hypothetical protein